MTPLKQILAERGIKSKWLAQQCGTEESWMNQVVNGKKIPNLKLAIGIAKTLGVSVEELWGYVDEGE